jgi:hypothetical protein
MFASAEQLMVLTGGVGNPGAAVVVYGRGEA